MEFNSARKGLNFSEFPWQNISVPNRFNSNEFIEIRAVKWDAYCGMCKKVTWTTCHFSETKKIVRCLWITFHSSLAKCPLGYRRFRIPRLNTKPINTARVRACVCVRVSVCEYVLISTCFGHHYAHRQENRLYKTACGVSLDMLAAVVWSRDTSWAHCVNAPQFLFYLSELLIFTMFWTCHDRFKKGHAQLI